MELERQKVWGKLAAFDMFFGGMGAGAFVVGFVLSLTNDMKWLALAGVLAGPVLVALGTLMLIIEAGAPRRAFRLLSGLSTSWMSRGGLIHALFIILGLVYAVPGFFIADWPGSPFLVAVGVVCLVLAFIIAAYHGLLMTQARGIPLWSSSVMPALSFFISLTTGLGLVLAMFPVFANLYAVEQLPDAERMLAGLGMGLTVGCLFVLWFLVSQRPNDTYAESINYLRRSVIADVICLFVAVALLAFTYLFGGRSAFPYITAVAGTALLVGGFIIRYGILRAGFYIPLRVYI